MQLQDQMQSILRLILFDFILLGTNQMVKVDILILKNRIRDSLFRKKERNKNST
jgi:hypothetical protein